MGNWQRHFQGLMNLFLESSCSLCQRSTGQELCKDCTKQVQSCQQACHIQQLSDMAVFTWGVYSGPLKRVIAALKYENQPQLARPLGYWLAQAWLDSPLAASQMIVVPIPLHPSKEKQRGYNQAALLAENFCKFTGLNLQLMGLERIRATDAQFGLSFQEREKNLAMAFTLGSGFRRHRPTHQVLLLDDIYTTGATVRSAMKTLHQAGIQVYGVAAIAAPGKGRGG